MVGQMDPIPQQLSVHIYEVNRFTAKFASLFKKHMEDVKDKSRLWTIVLDCTTALDMLKAAVLYNQYFPGTDQPEIRDIRAWFNENRNPLSRDIIVSGLNYFFSGVNKEHPIINDVELMEAAYHLNNQLLFQRLKQEIQVKVYSALAKQDLTLIVQLANQLEKSTFEDASISSWASTLSQYLGRRLINSRDRYSLFQAYKSLEVQRLTFNASIGGSFTLDDEFMDMLSSVESVKSLEFVSVDVKLVKISRRVTSLKIQGFKKSKDNNLNLAPMSLQSFEISHSDIDKDFFVGMPPIVKRLSIIKCEELEDGFIEFVPIVLTHLNVSNCVKLTDKFLRKIPKMLQSLVLWHVSNITNFGMGKLKDLNDLKELNIHGTLVSDNGVNLIPRGVEVLYLGNHITDKGLLDVPPRLKLLDLRDNKNVSKKGLCVLPSTIQEINLSMTNITDADLCALPTGVLKMDISYTKVQNPQLPLGLLSLTAMYTSLTDFSVLKQVPGLVQFATNTKLALKHVPRNVVCLTLDFSSINNLDDLPPDLVILNLSFVRSLKAEELGKVPKSLQMIDITDCDIDIGDARNYLKHSCVIIMGTEIHASN